MREFIFRLYDGKVDADGFATVQGRLTGEEIVRCQECRFRESAFCLKVNKPVTNKVNKPVTKLDGFCSNGQRKENT